MKKKKVIRLTDYDYIISRLLIERKKNSNLKEICRFAHGLDKDIEDVADIFHPELFSSVKSSNKEEVLSMLCEKSTAYFQVENLHSQVLQREEIGSTFFSKQIAVPHPMYAVSSDTFVAVCVSKEPIIWDEEKNEVHLVMLMHIGKNNPQAFQLWDYFSKMFADKSLVERLVEDPSYPNFIRLVKGALETGINSTETI